MLKKIINIFIFLSFFLIDFIVDLTKNRKKEEEKEILIIEFSNIGDFVLKIASIKKIREKNLEKKIDLICDISCKEIAEKIGYFDKIIAIDRRKFLRKIMYRYKTLKRLKKLNYKLIINLFYSRNIFADDWIIKNINSEKKIGLIGDHINKNFYTISNKWYTELIKTPEKVLFETERTHLFIKKIFELNYQNEYSDISDFFNDEFRLSKNYIVIFLGASNIRRAYPLKKMAEVLSIIPKEIDLVFCGVKSEQKLYNELIKLIVLENNKINLIGKTTLVQSINIIKNSKILIGNDSGPVHLAASLKKPSICVLGGGMGIGRFFPYKFSDETKEKIYLPKVIYKMKECFGCGWQCIQKVEENEVWPCVSEILVEEIKIKLSKLIKLGSEEC